MASSQLAVLDQKSDSNKCWAKTKCKELFLNQSYPVILAVGLLEKYQQRKRRFLSRNTVQQNRSCLLENYHIQIWSFIKKRSINLMYGL